jgi:adenylosuccinate lyase
VQLNPVTAISPIDGRYFNKTAELRPIFSEYGLFHFRVLIEIRWLQTLASRTDITEIGPFSEKTQQQLNLLIKHFNDRDAKQIKALEATTNHDIKAVEYFLKEKINANPELKNSSEFIHFACTSDDINNLAYALMLKEARKTCLIPALQKILKQLKNLTRDYAAQAMLARTHGQAAVPTTMGKELANFVFRLTAQLKKFSNITLQGKFNGAIGNYNAHRTAYPNVPWQEVSRQFVESLGLSWNPYTTQIEPHDYIAEYCDVLKRINAILINLSADMWGYISLGYFKQKSKTEETGSSTMPHKINPIDFENAEGNLSLANSLYQHFSNTLPRSRWQRDLRDSTLLRNLGVAFAHSLIAYKSLLTGLQKIVLDEERLATDLNQHWEILAEAIQTVLRKYGANLPYEQLKELTRGQTLDQKTLSQFIRRLSLPEEVKQQLLNLTPSNYLGFAVELAQSIDLFRNSEI